MKDEFYDAENLLGAIQGLDAALRPIPAFSMKKILDGHHLSDKVRASSR
jgi:hypothetical protein